METEDREPCPSCGEPTPIVGQICSYCRGSLLVNFVLEKPLTEERVAYEIARELKNQWPELSLVEIKRGLVTFGVPIVTGITREQAREIAAVLEQHGVVGRPLPQQVAVAASPGASETLRQRPLVVVAALVVLGIVLAVFFGQGDEEEAPPLPTASTPATRPAATPGAATTVTGFALTPRAIAQRSLASTVTLRCPDSEGSGFFVAPDLVVTNDHVICDGGDVEVELANGRRIHGVTERHDATLDIALVRVSENAGVPVVLGDATQLQRGDPVVAIGNPYGMELTLTQGIISHDARNVMGVFYLQIDANINPGNSGGPLFDPYGRVAGIVSMTVGESTGLGLALAVNYLYEGSRPFLPRPQATSSAAWYELLRKIEANDQREVDEMIAAFDQPRLLGAFLTAGKITAVVLLQEYSQPATQDFSFDFYNEGEYLCSARGNVRSWEEISDAYTQMLDARTREWLKKNDLLDSLWAGGSQVDLDACPEAELLGSEVWLDGVEPPASRRTVVSSGQGL